MSNFSSKHINNLFHILYFPKFNILKLMISIYYFLINETTLHILTFFQSYYQKQNFLCNISNFNDMSININNHCKRNMLMKSHRRSHNIFWVGYWTWGVVKFVYYVGFEWIFINILFRFIFERTFTKYIILEK